MREITTLCRFGGLVLGVIGLVVGASAQELIDRPAPLPETVKLIVGYNKVPHVSPLKLIDARMKAMNVDVQMVEFLRYADTRTALASGYRVTALDFSTSKAVGAELGLIGVSKPTLDGKREALRRFLWAYLDAQKEAMSSKEKLGETIAAWTGLEPKFAASVAKVTTLGQFLTMDQVKRQAQAFHQFGVLTKDVSGDLDKYFDQAILKTVVK